MGKILRITQKIFGLNAAAGQLGVFGSLAAGNPQTTTDPSSNPGGIQSLANFLGGWDSAVVGGNSPAIEDMNALHFLFAYQLAYLMQSGVAEYDPGTTYYTNSMVSSNGQVYFSLQDGNIGNALSNALFWQLQDSTPTGTIHTFAGPTSPPNYLLCDGTSYARASYPILFNTIGALYGAADANHFNVPDLRRRVPMGSGGAGTGVIGSVLGSTGGEENHALLSGESGLPIHNHALSGATDNADVPHNHVSTGLGLANDNNPPYGSAGATYAKGYDFVAESFTMPIPITSTTSINHSHTLGSATVNDAGPANATAAHNTIQPAIIMNFIIKT